MSKKKEARLPTEPFASFSKKESLISKRVLKLSLSNYLKPEKKSFKTYELSILGILLGNDMGCKFILTQALINHVANMDRRSVILFR